MPYWLPQELASLKGLKEICDLQVKAEISAEQAEVIGKLKTHPDGFCVLHCLPKLFQDSAAKHAYQDVFSICQ